MVIPFPAAKAARQPIGHLLTRVIGFLEGFEDDPGQQDVPQLLAQLRLTQDCEPILLQAPDKAPVHVSQRSTLATVGEACDGGFSFLKAHNDIDGRWFWLAHRLDDAGRSWQICGWAVVDDFGNLVEVPA